MIPINLEKKTEQIFHSILPIGSIIKLIDSKTPEKQKLKINEGIDNRGGKRSLTCSNFFDEILSHVCSSFR